MEIYLSNDITISEIQKEFNMLFPFLKIGFFSKSHKPFEGSIKKSILSPETKLKALKKEKAEVHISPGMTVNELEQLFKNKFGLNVQIFRKSGKSWLETTVTDSWTLEKQNEEGKELNDLTFE